MINCPNWIIPAMQKRFDDMDQTVEQDPRIQQMKREANKHFDGLKETMNAEQSEILKQWEDQMNYCVAMEKEALYRHGFIDGIHLSAAIFDSKLHDHMAGVPSK